MGQSIHNRTPLTVGILLGLAGLAVLLLHGPIFQAVLPFAVENASLDHSISERGEFKIHVVLYAGGALAVLAGICVTSPRRRNALAIMHLADPAFPSLATGRFHRRVFWCATLGGLMISTLWVFSEGLGISSLYDEDRIFENVATAGFTLAAILLVQPVLHLRKSYRGAPVQRSWRWLVVFYLLLISGFVVITGEEISWGQRLFGWETPELVAAVNEQNETNLHNLYNNYFVLIYYGFAGIIPFHIAAMVLPFRKRDTRIASMLLPHPSLNVLGLVIAVNSAFLWRGELTEELLALYCVLFAGHIFFGTRNLNNLTANTT